MNKKKWLLVILACVLGVCILVLVIFGLWKIFFPGQVSRKNFTDSGDVIVLSEEFTDRQINNENDAKDVVTDAGKLLGIRNMEECISDASCDSAGENTYYRFQQEYEGIPVYGRSLVVAADGRGEALSFTGNYQTITDVSVKADIESSTVRKDLTDIYGSDAEIIEKGLVIYSLNDCDPQLSWDFLVMSPDAMEECLVSASDGEILYSNLLADGGKAECSGEDLDGIIQKFDAEYNGDQYVMEDAQRNITMYDANNSTLQQTLVVLDSQNRIYYYKEGHFEDSDGNPVYVDLARSPNVITDAEGNVIEKNARYSFELKTKNPFTEVEPVSSESSYWENPKAVTLMDHLEWLYDYWNQQFARNGFDNRNGEVVAVINTYDVNDKTNSFSFGAYGLPVSLLEFRTDCSLSLNTVSHEYMHSIVRAVCGLSHSGESGAIHEAYCDIFAEIIEDWEDDGEYNNSCDWITLGRNHISPETADSPLPCAYQDHNWKNPQDLSDGDEGGVHTNCVVLSHAAYLMTTDPERGGYEKLSTYDLGRLFYETLYSLPMDCDFGDLCTLMQNTAEIQYREGLLTSQQRDWVYKVFNMCGISSSSMVVSMQLDLDVYDISDDLFTDYTLYVQNENGENVKEYQGERIEKEGLRFPEEGWYSLRIVDNTNAENEKMLRVFVLEFGGASQLAVYTACGQSDVNELIEETMPIDIQFVRSEDSGKEYAVITAISAQGKEMWTHETGKYECAQLERVSELTVWGEYYLYLEDGTVTALNLRDGSVAWENEDFQGAGAAYAFGKEDTLYLCGYLGPDFFVIDKDGNTVYRLQDMDEQVYGPYSIEYEDGEIRVYFENSQMTEPMELCALIDPDDFTYDLPYQHSDGMEKSSFVDDYLLYYDSQNPSNILKVLSKGNSKIIFTAFWYGLGDISDVEAVQKGSTADFSYTDSDTQYIAKGRLTLGYESAELMLAESTVPYVEPGTYSYLLGARKLSKEQLESIREALGAPENAEITEGEPSYWDGGRCFTTPVFFLQNGKVVASASVHALTGELTKDILTYNAT